LKNPKGITGGIPLKIIPIQSYNTHGKEKNQAVEVE
jgi:hypothetical protein